MHPDILYELYNDPRLSEEFSKLDDVVFHRVEIVGFWDEYCGSMETIDEIYMECELPLTLDEFRENIKYKFDTIARQHIINNTAIDPEELFAGKLPSKSDATWGTIGWKNNSLKYPFYYEHYKKKNPKFTGEYEKYYKIRGTMLKSAEWAEKFKDIKAIDDNQYYKYKNNFIIPARMMAIFEEEFLKTDKEIFWPFMTNLVPIAEIRELPDYPLISTTDLLKIEYLTSFIIDKEVENRLLRDFIKQFLVYKKEDVKLWCDKIAKTNKKYGMLLEDARKFKKTN